MHRPAVALDEADRVGRRAMAGIVAEGHEAKRRHQQQRGEDEGEVVEGVLGAAIDQRRQPVRAAQPLEPVHPAQAACQRRSQPRRRQAAVAHARGEPELPAQQAADANQHDRRAEHRAHPRDRDRDQEHQGQQDGDQQQAFVAEQVQQLAHAHVVGRHARDHALDLGAQALAVAGGRGGTGHAAQSTVPESSGTNTTGPGRAARASRPVRQHRSCCAPEAPTGATRCRPARVVPRAHPPAPARRRSPGCRRRGCSPASRCGRRRGVCAR